MPMASLMRRIMESDPLDAVRLSDTTFTRGLAAESFSSSKRSRLSS